MEAAALGLRVDGVDNIDRASSSLGRLADSAKNAETASGQLDRASRSSSKSLSEVTRESDRASRSMGALASAIKPVAASLAAAFSIRSLAQYADSWSDMTSLVRVNIGAHEDAAEVMGRLADIARGTYSSMELTAQSFARNAFTLNALGKSTKQQLDYTQALNNALVVSGAKGHAAELVQNALSRAMAEGALRGEDLNLVLNYGSRVASLLAEQLGVNVTELRDLAKEGKITGDVIFQSVVAGMEAVTKEAESMPATISDGFLLLRNSVLQAVGVFDQANGISEKFAERLVKLADAIREVDLEPVIAAATVLASVIGARLASSALASAAAFSAAQIEVIRYQAALASMAGVSRTTAVGLTAMSAAARTATAAMALVGGPAGAIMLAAGALVYFATRTSEAEKAQQEYNAALDAADRYMTAARSGSTELAAKYREEADAALDAARQTLELERARVQSAIAAASVASNDPLDRFAAGMAGMTDSQAERKRQEALAGWEARLARIDERLAAIAEKEAKVGQTAVAEGAGGAGGAADAGTVEQFEKLEAQLQRQLALYGQTTELAKLRYEMEHGSLQGLNDAQQLRLEQLAAELDAKAALAEKEKELDALRKEIERASLERMDPVERERERYALQLENLRAFHEEKLITQEELWALELEAFLNHEAALTEAAKKGAQERALAEQQAQQTIQAMRTQTAQLAIGLLQTYAGQSKTIAIATIALEKGLALAQAAMNTAVGVTKAYTVDPTGALAAQVALMGKVQMGLIAATGLAQASQVDPGGAALGTAANPVHTAPSTAPTPAPAAAPTQRIYVEFEGSDDRKVTLREFREQIRRIKEENPDAELVF